MLDELREDLKAKFIDTYIECEFNVSKASDVLGISRRTPYLWMSKDPVFKDDVRIAREALIDLVESSLIKKAKKGNVAAQIFFLKTQGRHRGYVERTEFRKLPDSMDGISDEELMNRLIQLKEKYGTQPRALGGT